MTQPSLAAKTLVCLPTGPYVINFDGKEDAVINALNATLQPVDPVAINITSYTVGAPVSTRFGSVDPSDVQPPQRRRSALACLPIYLRLPADKVDAGARCGCFLHCGLRHTLAPRIVQVPSSTPASAPNAATGRRRLASAEEDEERLSEEDELSEGIGAWLQEPRLCVSASLHLYCASACTCAGLS